MIYFFWNAKNLRDSVVITWDVVPFSIYFSSTQASSIIEHINYFYNDDDDIHTMFQLKKIVIGVPLIANVDWSN